MDAELAAVQPKMILALGATAAKAMAGKAKITQVHGEIFSKGGYRVMPAFHPAYCLRDPSKLPALTHDLERLVRAMRGEEPSGDIDYRMLTSKNFDKFIEDLRNTTEYSFDVETSNLRWFDRKTFRIRTLNLGLDNRSWVVHFEVKGTPLYRRPDAQFRMIMLIADLLKGKTSIGQNGKYDTLCILFQYGVYFDLDFDTMLASHVLNENEPHDLEYISRVYLDAPSYDIPLKEKTTEEFSERRVEYGAKDGDYTRRLRSRFAAMLREDPRVKRLFYQLVMPAARAMARVESRGLTIDMPEFTKTEIKIRAEVEDLSGKLKAVKDINWNAAPQVAGVLFGDLGLKSTVLTDGGKPSTGEAALVDLKGKHEVVDLLIKYRERAKFLSTYIEGWKEYIVDGRLYLGYKLHGTVTGRYSSRLHQIPRDGEIRSLVTAPLGWVFGQADLSQAELRIAAELSGDLELISCFRPGGQDVHWRTLLHMIGAGHTDATELSLWTARRITSLKRITLTDALEILSKQGHDKAIEHDKSWKEWRKKAKAINFGYVFGMYENKFIETAKTKYGWEPTWEEAHAIRQGYFELYRSVIPWHDKQKRICRIDGGVRNLFGRLRRLPGINSTDRELRGEAERQSINSPVQGTIGDWKAAAVIDIDAKIDPDELAIVGEHHDAILFIVRNDHVVQRRVLPIVRESMRKPSLLERFKIRTSVPMESEIELGKWGSGKKWNG